VSLKKIKSDQMLTYAIINNTSIYHTCLSCSHHQHHHYHHHRTSFLSLLSLLLSFVSIIWSLFSLQVIQDTANKRQDNMAIKITNADKIFKIADDDVGMIKKNRTCSN